MADANVAKSDFLTAQRSAIQGKAEGFPSGGRFCLETLPLCPDDDVSIGGRLESDIRLRRLLRDPFDVTFHEHAVGDRRRRGRGRSKQFRAPGAF